MSDCERCWDTPCTCGYGYRNYTKGLRIKLAAVILGIDTDTLLAGYTLDPFIPTEHPMKGE